MEDAPVGERPHVALSAFTAGVIALPKNAKESQHPCQQVGHLEDAITKRDNLGAPHFNSPSHTGTMGAVSCAQSQHSQWRMRPTSKAARSRK